MTELPFILYSAKHVWVGCEGRNGTSDELRGFGVGQVEPLCRFHHLFRPDESRVEKTTAMPYGLSSVAMSTVSLSVAAFDTP